MDTFDDVINYAIRMEELSIQLYSQLAEQVGREEIKQVFLDMVRQEEGHKMKLEQVLQKHQLPGGKRFYPDPDLHLADYVVDVDPSQPDLNLEDALIIGMKMERAAMKLYQDMADRQTDPDLKEIFLYLVEEEAKHKHNFEAKFDDRI